MFLLLFLMAFQDPAQVLVLKNGREIPLVKPHRVDGQQVLFEGKNGQLMMLPLKIVDLNRTEQRNQELALLRAQKAAEKPVEKPKPRLADLVDHVEESRGISLNNEALEQYADDHPREMIDAVESDAAFTTTRDRLKPKETSSKAPASNKSQQWEKEAYERRIRALRKQINDDKKEIQRLKRSSEGRFYSLNQLAWKEGRVEDLEEDIREAQKKIMAIKTEARKKRIKLQVH